MYQSGHVCLKTVKVYVVLLILYLLNCSMSVLNRARVLRWFGTSGLECCGGRDGGRRRGIGRGHTLFSLGVRVRVRVLACFAFGSFGGLFLLLSGFLRLDVFSSLGIMLVE